MRKKALAIWPLWQPKLVRLRPIEPQPEKWVQEEEVLKIRLLEPSESAQEKIQRLLPGLDLKTWIL